MCGGGHVRRVCESITTHYASFLRPPVIEMVPEGKVAETEAVGLGKPILSNNNDNTLVLVLPLVLPLVPVPVLLVLLVLLVVVARGATVYQKS